MTVLDSMADRFQTVAFTHHEHLAELAQHISAPGRAHLHPCPILSLRRSTPRGGSRTSAPARHSCPAERALGSSRLTGDLGQAHDRYTELGRSQQIGFSFFDQPQHSGGTDSS